MTTRKMKKSKEDHYSKNEEAISAFILSILDQKDLIDSEIIRTDFEEQFGEINEKNFELFTQVIEKLIDENKEIKINKNYMRIIHAFEVVKRFEKKLSFTSTEKRVRIFQLLSKMSLQIADSKILPYTHSKNIALRKEARIAYIGVSSNDPFKFFNSKNNNKLSEWEQMSLANQFEEHHQNSLPDFGKWIKYSEEQSQKIFFIRLASRFNQTTAKETLIDLLDTNSHVIRKEVILALGNLKILEVENKIKSMYYEQPNDVQIAIINYINTVNSGESLDFLHHIYLNTLGLETKQFIVEAIYLYTNGGQELFEKLHAAEEGFNELIFEHVKNKLISGRLRKANTSIKNRVSIPGTDNKQSSIEKSKLINY